MKKLFSGVKPTGKIHLGNYLGALKNWVDLQSKYDCIYSIVDMHALTIDIHPDELRDNSLKLAIDLLALGIDPKKSLLFRQSDVVGHTELAWIFNCLTPVSELERMTQFKDEASKKTGNINAGLLTYPVLQAADILLYRAETVPVGEDQLQHLELTRIIARKFNNRYQRYFPESKPIISPARRVMSLKYPDKKMSKSHGEASYIAIRDDEVTITKKIKKAVTDEQGILNLLELYSYFGQKEKYEEMMVLHKSNKLMSLQLKEELTKAVLEFLKPVQEKIAYYEDNESKVEKILRNGAKKAQRQADQTMAQVKQIVGLK
ncbi:MAG: tryptophan--tRNA ligase [Candidatus Komeilibacteria bacterium]|jgi:tryptophanyl-tRNA synthetase|nr:tryptophan--tRNA ligase [Candidatus Komeilibacteria bacterium]